MWQKRYHLAVVAMEFLLLMTKHHPRHSNHPETFKARREMLQQSRATQAEAGAARAWAAVPGASVCPRRGGRPRPLAPACAPPPAPTCTHPLACALARKPLSRCHRRHPLACCSAAVCAGVPMEGESGKVVW